MSSAYGPIKTYLISGFLGAGKTTFILEQLKSTGSKVAVLVNEFGELGIDGALIRSRSGFDVVEMPGGCICCSKKDGLVESIRRIAAEMKPELLLIEPSGIAECSEILKVLAAPSLAGVIQLEAALTVIDAETFLAFSAPEGFGTFFLDQVINADLIVVNKVDLVGSAELAAIEGRIEELQPGALLVKTTYCRMDGILPSGRGAAPVLSSGVAAAMSCISIVPGKDISSHEMEAFMAEAVNGGFGNVVRGKGFVQVRDKGCMNLQIVSGRVSLDAFPEGADSRLTLIGFNLDGELIRDFLRSNTARKEEK